MTEPHVYDYSEGGAIPAPIELTRPKPDPGVYDTSRPTPINLDNLPLHVRGFRYVAQCSKCARWAGGHDFTRIVCAFCHPNEARREHERWGAVKLPEHTMESLTKLALARGEEIVRLKAELADAYAQRDKYATRINTAIRKLEGW